MLCATASSSMSFARDHHDSLGIKNAIVIECLGHGISPVSANHEHTFKRLSKASFLTYRYGIGITPGYNDAKGDRKYAVWSVPLVL